MTVVPLSIETWPAWRARVMSLNADTPRKWGSLTPAGMLRHLRYLLECSLGETQVEDKSNVLMRTVVRWLVFHVLPWPKGSLKAPAHFTPACEHDFEEERRLFLDVFERFVQAVDKEPARTGVHEIFGQHPLGYWAHMHSRHFEHHMRQFGI